VTDLLSPAAEGACQHGENDYRFCPRCGGSLQRQVVKPSEPEQLVCGHCGFIFYLDPKVVVGTIGTIDDRIVLLRRGIEPAYGHWVFPGGFVNRGETVEQAGIREAKEEVNLDVRIQELLNVYSYPEPSFVFVVYSVAVVGGNLRAADEAIEVGTFSPGNIPWQGLAFRSTHDALRDYTKRYFGSGVQEHGRQTP